MDKEEKWIDINIDGEDNWTIGPIKKIIEQLDIIKIH